MKLTTIKRFMALAPAAMLLAFAGCEKDASDEAFGTEKVYMPQATVSNLNYLVPAGRDSSNFNFKIDAASNKVNVILGVTRSGALDAGAYSVNIAANPDTITQLISNAILPAATTVVMPSSIYTLPVTVSVPSGKLSATFNLSIDKTQLKTYAGKKVAIGVVISSPSTYILNMALNKVVVIIDVAALKL